MNKIFITFLKFNPPHTFFVKNVVSQKPYLNYTAYNCTERKL